MAMIYLDNGATSFPKPPGMAETMARCMKTYCGNPGRSGHYMSMKTGEEVYRARKIVAGLFHIKRPERLIFTMNTTGALNAGIKGVLCRGDHAVTTAMEHNSVLRPLKALEQGEITHTIVNCKECGTVEVKNILGAIKQNTRLVICTHASNVTGTLQPIAELGAAIKEMNCSRRPEQQILFLVDGAQSAGCVPIDVEKMCIDMLAIPGHKGLLGPLGTGALYVREGVDIYPVTEGGTGTASKERVQPLEFPEGFEAGTVNAPGIIGLGYSAAWVQRVGVENIQRHEEALVAPLHEALMNMDFVKVYGPDHFSETAPEAEGEETASSFSEKSAVQKECTRALKTAVVTFNAVDKDGKVHMSCEEVADRLSGEYGIAVRGGFHCAGLAHKTIGTWDTGAVRMSAGPFNTKKQIKIAIDAVYHICRP